MKDSILVTTEKLIQKEEEWKILSEKAKKTFFEAVESVDMLEQFFSGKPVKELKRIFVHQKQEGESAFEALTDHINKLEYISITYEQAERSNRDFFKKN